MLFFSSSQLCVISSLYILCLIFLFDLEFRLRLLYLLSSFGLSHCRVNGSRVFRNTLAMCKLCVQLVQVRNYFFCIEGLPKLKVSASLQELTHALWFADTWHLYHDTSFFTFQLLDIRLYYTKLVDTSSYHIK